VSVATDFEVWAPSAMRCSEAVRVLEHRELSLLLGAMSHRRALSGEVLFRLGDPARTLYLLRSGRVGLTLPLEVQGLRRDLMVEEEGPGCILGWSTLVPPHRYTASAKALEDCTLGVVDGAELDAVLELYPGARERVTAAIAHMMRERLARWQSAAVRSVLRWVGLT
jgi:CRP-like cAMP-binding protein